MRRVSAASAVPSHFPWHAATRGALVVCALAFSAGALGGCNESEAEDLPVWTPADHDNQGAPAQGQVDTSKPRPGMPDLAKQGVDEVVLATWKQNCVRCHGLIGRGDGPDGRALRPPDFTSARWQKNAIDSEIRRTIKKGRGQMPGFSQIPDSKVDGLVRLVRMLGPRSAAATEPNQGADGSAQPDDAAQRADAAQPPDADDSKSPEDSAAQAEPAATQP